jgi:hypothetical protein
MWKFIEYLERKVKQLNEDLWTSNPNYNGFRNFSWLIMFLIILITQKFKSNWSNGFEYLYHLIVLLLFFYIFYLIIVQNIRISIWGIFRTIGIILLITELILPLDQAIFNNISNNKIDFNKWEWDKVKYNWEVIAGISFIAISELLRYLESIVDNLNNNQKTEK